MATKTEHTKVIKFLAGLNDSYSNARGQIIMKKHVPILSEVYNLLDQDFNQHSIAPLQNATAFQVTSPDDLLASVNATYNSKTTRLVCSHCGYNGHTVDKCYKIHGYPPNFKHKKNPSSEKQGNNVKPVVAQLTANDSKRVEDTSAILNTLSKDQIQSVIDYFNAQLQPSQVNYASTSTGTITAMPGMAFSSSTIVFVGILRATDNVLSSTSWIIDSGATHHVSHDRALFESFTESVNRSVTLLTGQNITIKGIGQIRLNEYLLLNNVLYIPDFRLNLLSISHLTKDLGCRVMFDHSSCLIQDPIKGLMIGQGEEIANLYVMDGAFTMDHATLKTLPSINVVVDNSLWHSRLGHPAMDIIYLITDVLGIKQKNKGVFHCSICPLAKQKHIPYVSNNNIRTHAFDLLHIDIWGPFSEPTPEGYIYFLTIVDDHTRVTWIYLLRTKSEVLQVFPDFLTMVEKQYNAHVKGVRSDNAPELRFTALYKKKGIIAYHSCPETPQQNSVVERKHQHILNVARSLMFQSHSPLQYWGDCVLTAVFLINRLPTPLLDNKSPYQVLTHHLPNYKDLRVFGCLVYCSTSPKNRHKFQPRAKPCAFLGYPAGCKGYKLLDLETETIIISRNVVFHEDIFPFQHAGDMKNDFFSILNPATVVPSCDHVDITTAKERESQAVDDSHDIVDVVPAVERESPAVVNDILPQGTTSAETSNNAKRKGKSLAYLHDYYCNLTETEIPYPLASYISLDKLSEGYKSYICAIALHPEPSSFTQAKKFTEWLDAMNEELKALEATHTWDIVSLPSDKRAIGCKWVYKIKLNADGTLERYKARLVAKGYTQQEGIDYVETFSPVAKMTTVKTLLVVSAAKKWHLKQLDISNAFLNGELTEEIYMKLPPGYTPKPGVTLPPNAVCKLNKSLYGLKQASRQWFLKFSATLTLLGFKQSHSDHTLFIRRIDGRYIAVLVYVDDIIIASTTEDDAVFVTNSLSHHFKLRDLGPLRYFLGLEIARSSEGISVTQLKYTLELLEDTGYLASKTSSVPMEPSNILCQDSTEPLLDDPLLHRRLVGKLMYLTITRPDITFAVNKLCQYCSAPKPSHLKAAYRVLQYLKGTIGLGLFYSSTNDLVLTAFTDADWNSCKDSRRSTSGFCMFLGHSLISWKSKKQETVSHSSAESEYRAMSFAVREVQWLVNMLRDFEAPQLTPVPFFCDSTAAIHIANNAVFHERTKHLESDCHKVRDMVKCKLIKTLHVTSTNQLADTLLNRYNLVSFILLLARWDFFRS